MKKIQTNKNNKQVIWADSFGNGVEIGKQDSDEQGLEFPPLSLEMNDQKSILRSRYQTTQSNDLAVLEGKLLGLQRKGELENSVITFGVSADPFHPFESRFDTSMKFLELFERYSAGQIIIQTRSPLIVIAMPVLRKLKDRVIVTVPIETSSPEAVARYTPHLPRLSDRLRVASVLRKFGIPVHMQVCPLLPYGDIKKDAAAFASMLTTNANYISVKPVFTGNEDNRKRSSSVLMDKLAADRQFAWLRPNACSHLLQCIELLAPDKLNLPDFRLPPARQLTIFAA